MDPKASLICKRLYVQVSALRGVGHNSSAEAHLEEIDVGLSDSCSLQRLAIGSSGQSKRIATKRVPRIRDSRNSHHWADPHDSRRDTDHASRNMLG